MKQKPPKSDTLKQLRADMQVWRKNRRRRRIPEALWESAVELAQEHGVSRIARSVGLSQQALKDRVVAAESRDNGQAPKGRVVAAKSRNDVQVPKGRAIVAGAKDDEVRVEFVELDMKQVGPLGVAHCVVELHDSRGAKMVIQMTGQNSLDLVALAALFWRAGV